MPAQSPFHFRFFFRSASWRQQQRASSEPLALSLIAHEIAYRGVESLQVRYSRERSNIIYRPACRAAFKLPVPFSMYHIIMYSTCLCMLISVILRQTVRAVVKVVTWSRGGGLTWRSQVGATPIPIPRPTNLTLFWHKITLYRFNQGAHTIAGGSNRRSGAEPLLALSL